MSSTVFVVLCWCIGNGMLVEARGQSESAPRTNQCSDVQIGRRQDGCLAEHSLSSSFHQGVPIILFQKDMDTLCREVDTILACLDTQTLPACSSMYHDVAIYNATFTTICNNKEKMLASQLHCEPDDMFQDCLRMYRSEVVALHQHYKLKTIPTAAMCRVYSDMQSCIHMNATNSCTEDLAAYLTTLYKGRFAPSACRAGYGTAHMTIAGENEDVPSSAADVLRVGLPIVTSITPIFLFSYVSIARIFSIYNE